MTYDAPSPDDPTPGGAAYGEPTHHEVAALLGAYALDATDADEAAAVERHLAVCPQCAAELASYHEVAGMLANTGSDAPAGLWDRIAAQLQKPPDDVRAPIPFRLTAPSGPRPRRRRPRWAAAAAASLAAAVAIVALGVQVGRLDHRVGQLATASGQQGLSQAANAALVDPGARRITLASTTKGAPPAAGLVILPSGSAYLLNSRLPSLPAGRTYQLWSLEAGGMVSVSLLGDRPTTVAFTVNAARSATPFAITVEPAGGSVSPTTTPVAASTS